MLTITTMTLSSLAGCGQPATSNTNEDLSTEQNTEVKSTDEVMSENKDFFWTTSPLDAQMTISNFTFDEVYKKYVDGTFTLTFEGTYIETGASEVETTEEPTTEDEFDGFYSDSYKWEFPDGMEGFTDKFVIASDESMSFNCTHYVAKDGTEMNFTWMGPTKLGERAGAGDKTLSLYGDNSNYELRAWNSGELKLEELEECLALEKNVWTSLSGSNTTYPEDGYYNVERIDNIVYVKYAVKTDTMKGYSYFICNDDAGNYYMFTYLKKNEIYDATRAMNVINNIKLTPNLFSNLYFLIFF